MLELVRATAGRDGPPSRKAGDFQKLQRAGAFSRRVPRRNAVPAARWGAVLSHELHDKLLQQQPGSPVTLPGTFMPKAPFLDVRAEHFP